MLNAPLMVKVLPAVVICRVVVPEVASPIVRLLQASAPSAVTTVPPCITTLSELPGTPAGLQVAELLQLPVATEV